MSNTRYTIIGINRKTGLASTVYVGWGEASFEYEEDAIEEAQDWDDEEVEYKVIPARKGWEWEAASDYNKSLEIG